MIGLVRRWRQRRRAAVLRALNPFAPSTNRETARIVSLDAGSVLFALTGGVRRTLRKFEREGLVESFVAPSEADPRRSNRYYRLTDRGKAARDALLLAARAKAYGRKPR